MRVHLDRPGRAGLVSAARPGQLGRHCCWLPGAPAWLASPGIDGVEYSRALVSAFGEAGRARSPEAAADVLLNTATKVHG